jgi:putative heme-binding domain-containing protein
MESRYTNYLVETQKGRLYDGLLSAETSAVVTLRGELEDVTLLRRNIKDIRASRISLMPEGFEKTLNRQELADVIAFLRAGL